MESKVPLLYVVSTTLEYNIGLGAHHVNKIAHQSKTDISLRPHFGTDRPIIWSESCDSGVPKEKSACYWLRFQH